MNILLVSDVSVADVIGGAERMLYEQATRLVQRGHRVVHLTRRLPEHRFSSGEIDGVRECRYSASRRGPLSFLYSTMKNGGRLFDHLHGKYSFDVVNFHQPFSALAVCARPAAAKVRKIYTCHSLSFEEYESRNHRPAGFPGKMSCEANVFCRKRMERYCLGRSDGVCVLSRYTLGKLRRAHGVEENKIAVIPGGVDLRRFHPAIDKKKIRGPIGIPTDRFVLLTVRNLVPRMGLENLLKAFAEARRTLPELFLVIGGAGPLLPELSKIAEMSGQKEHVHFAGFIPEKKLADYYRSADLFVLPTRELEGFGLVTVESMACGTPVLGTPVGGTKEIIGGFDEDFLFAGTSASDIAKKLRSVCENFMKEPSALESVSRRCREYAKANYSWENNIQALESLLAD